MASTLARWLATRSADELADILRRRRDALAGYAPQNLSEAAERLQSTAAMRDLLLGMPKPCVEVAEVILAYGARDTAGLADVFHRPPDDPTLAATLATCEQWAFAWPYDNAWHVPSALRTLLPEPFELGPPAAGLLAQRTVDDLRQRLRAQRSSAYQPRLKADVIAALGEFYADPERVRDAVAKAPPAQRDLIRRAAAGGPVLPYDGTYLYTGRPDRAISYLIEMGLAIANWQEILVPREVALAIRGDDWHPTLTPAPPVDAGPPLDADAVDRDAAATAATALHEVAALLAVIGTQPVTLRKTGDIGVREIRRLSSATGVAEPGVRLWLDLAAESGLVRAEAGELVPTDGTDVWLSAAPADQLAVLYAAWRDRLAVPTFEPPKSDVPATTLLAYAARLRPDILETAAALGPGVPVGSVDSLAARIAWRRPLAASLFADPAAVVSATWREAAMLGVIGRGAVSTLGRALIDGAGVAEVAGALLPARTTEAIFQADLTALVAGSPDPAVMALLDTVADRESRGAAVTWRVTAGSVRRALDSGRSPTALLAALRAIAVGGLLPQPLEYLVTDVARRHGGIRVRSVGCVLRAGDESVLAEILATRTLAGLGLVALAPTVLASAADAERTLAALRAAGFAPMAEDATGAVLVEPTAPRRAAPGPHGPTGAVIPLRRAPVDPAALADALLAAPPPATHPATPVPKSRAELLIARHARHLSPYETKTLAHAVNTGEMVTITYTDSAGTTTTRLIEPIEMDEQAIVAWCHLRGDERNFILSRIRGVNN